jgi:hypothetical protein
MIKQLAGDESISVGFIGGAVNVLVIKEGYGDNVRKITVCLEDASELAITLLDIVRENT